MKAKLGEEMELQKKKRIRELKSLIEMYDRSILHSAELVADQQNKKTYAIAELKHWEEGGPHCMNCKHQTGWLCLHPKLTSHLECMMNKPMYKYWEAKESK